MNFRCLLIAVSCVGCATAVAAPPVQPWFPKAPPLPKPIGQVIEVDNVEELFRAAGQVAPGGTILLADGHYMMPRYFELHTDGVTLRGASGDRDKVILDGANSRHGELVGVTACSGVTVADLTIQNIKYNGFKLNSDKNVQRVTIYNCVIHNIWQRGVKGVRVPKDDPRIKPPTGCRVQFCLFHNDRPKQFSDDPADTPQNFNGNYIGGIDVMYPRGWTISDNVFVGIRGRTGEARGAVFLWHDAEDCVVERNVIIDCDSGICLGNSHRAEGTEIHARRCVVRNNFLTGCAENGILADYTADCRILHNTIHHPTSRLKRLIRLVHDNNGLLVANNLLSGPPMRIETGSQVQLRGNVTRELTAAFVDAARGNLHLKTATPGVSDAADPLPEVVEDIDRQGRGKRPDVGADQVPQ
ncbi:MAG: right-handed parallel beta-helix repeat-containing protein [Candidatus Nealsonbacteria bacterium]|nr:right-handed parallel beta-helix repeat-containing protein [Candidatus Nealsonbacteria bacterium]